MSERTWKRLTDKDEKVWNDALNELAEAQLQMLLKRIRAIGWKGAIDELNKIIRSEEYAAIFAALIPSQGLKYFKYINSRVKSVKDALQVKEISPEDQYFLYMREYLDQRTGVDIVSITETARKESLSVIRNAVDQALEEGSGEIDLIRLIERNVALEWRIRSIFRAQRIARTEVASLANRASFLGVEQTNLPYRKRWETFMDNRTRSSHIAIHGTTIEPYEMFEVGSSRMMYPLDPRGEAKEVINCRCRLSYEVE